MRLRAGHPEDNMSKSNVVPFMASAVEKPRVQSAPTLRRLSPTHRELISLLLQGMGSGDAAAIVGYTRQRVTQLLGDPLFQTAMDEQRQLWDVELSNLTGNSVAVLRDALTDKDPEVRLKAARMQLETQGKFRQGTADGTSAEDAVAKIISLAVTNMQINVGLPNAVRPAEPGSMAATSIAEETEDVAAVYSAGRALPQPGGHGGQYVGAPTPDDGAVQGGAGSGDGEPAGRADG